jgi:phage terminase small subunit
MSSEIELYMMPPASFSPYAKSLWTATLKMMDGEALFPADYALLECFCQTAEQLRSLNEKVSIKKYEIVDGMVKPNPLMWNAQSLAKTLALISDKLGMNRVMKEKGGTSPVPKELLAFLRGTADDAKLSV